MKIIKNRFNLIIFVAIYLLTLVCYQCVYANFDENVLFIRAYKDHINNNMGHGTAFIVNINGEKYIVTCYHTVKDAIKDSSTGLPKVEFYRRLPSGQVIKITFDKCSGDRFSGQDLVFFRIDPSANHLIGDGFGLDNSFNHANVNAIARCYDTQFTPSVGTTISLNSKQVYIASITTPPPPLATTTEPTVVICMTNCQLVGGNSGSPVIYGNKVIGIVTSSKYESDGQNQANAIHAREISECLEIFHQELAAWQERLNRWEEDGGRILDNDGQILGYTILPYIMGTH